MKRASNYDKYPATHISGFIKSGWEEVNKELLSFFSIKPVLCLDCYTGINEAVLLENIKLLKPELIINTSSLMKSEETILSLTDRFMTDDILFGYVTNLSLEDYFDKEKIEKVVSELKEKARVVVYGPGASFISKGEDTTLVYLDMARWEIQQRFRAHNVNGLGVVNSSQAVSLQYKRGYFNDWRILDKYKDSLFDRIDYYLDTNDSSNPKLIDKATFFRGIDKTSTSPFRVVPFFDPAPWGGQWMKEVCALDRTKANYGWCFDCVPEENSLYFDVDGTVFELPCQDLVLLRTKEVLGGPVEARFGKDFPIRFDFLDTIEGGNLSLQVHPTTQFIRENMGMYYTQDESYYLLDATENASVYLGLKTGVDRNEMLDALREAQNGGPEFDAEKYVNHFKAKKHDHYLIPGGTVHCSGSGALVLEISSTPNLFTFKLWDWGRLGLDGKPRPINIERGSKVIDFSRTTEFVKKNLANHIIKLRDEDGLIEERTGLHENEFIETRRYWFSVPLKLKTGGSVNVFNLIEGEEAIITSPSDCFEPFIVHYAETFIIPDSVKEYEIKPFGKSEGETIGVIRAYVRF